MAHETYSTNNCLELRDDWPESTLSLQLEGRNQLWALRQGQAMRITSLHELAAGQGLRPHTKGLGSKGPLQN